MKTLTLLMLMLIVSCQEEEFYKKFKPESLKKDDIKSPVCDPFSKTSTAKNNNGIKAQIIDGTGYFPMTLSEFEGKPILFNDVYLSQISVPTRRFADGFNLSDGSTLENSAGEKLIEWFKIQGEGNVVLDSSFDEEGYYEFAFIADDGAKLSIDSSNSGVYETVLNYSGVTPSRFICGSNIYRFKFNEPYKFRVEYFQGPKYNISFNLLWRKVKELDADVSRVLALLPGEQDLECGMSGNERYFNGNSDSKPTPIFNSLTSNNLGRTSLTNGGLRLSGGWKVLSPTNFILPNQLMNPCSLD